jgi:hypothetical protein
VDTRLESENFDQFALGELRMLLAERPSSFSLNLAICNDTSIRSALVQELCDKYKDIEIISFWPYTESLFEHVQERMEKGPRDALFVAGLEDALAADIDRNALLQKLNSSPLRWKAWFACPVVFWLDDMAADILRHHAPDFWEWQTGLFRLDAKKN